MRISTTRRLDALRGPSTGVIDDNSRRLAALTQDQVKKLMRPPLEQLLGVQPVTVTQATETTTSGIWKTDFSATVPSGKTQTNFKSEVTDKLTKLKTATSSELTTFIQKLTETKTNENIVVEIPSASVVADSVKIGEMTTVETKTSGGAGGATTSFADRNGPGAALVALVVLALAVFT